MDNIAISAPEERVINLLIGRLDEINYAAIDLLDGNLDDLSSISLNSKEIIETLKDIRRLSNLYTAI